MTLDDEIISEARRLGRFSAHDLGRFMAERHPDGPGTYWNVWCHMAIPRLRRSGRLVAEPDGHQIEGARKAKRWRFVRAYVRKRVAILAEVR